MFRTATVLITSTIRTLLPTFSYASVTITHTRSPTEDEGKDGIPAVEPKGILVEEQSREHQGRRVQQSIFAVIGEKVRFADLGPVVVDPAAGGLRSRFG